MTNAVLRGKPDAGNPHVRFDEGEVASYPPTLGRPAGVAMRGAKPGRGSLLYNFEFNRLAVGAMAMIASWVSFAGTLTWSGGAGDNDWTKPGNYAEGAAPQSGDVVTVLDGATVRIASDDMNSWALASSLSRIAPQTNGSKIEIYVDEGVTNDLSCGISWDGTFQSKFGVIEKSGGGTVCFKSNSGGNYDYHVNELNILQGTVDTSDTGKNSKAQYYGDINIAEGAVFYSSRNQITWVLALHGNGEVWSRSDWGFRVRGGEAGNPTVVEPKLVGSIYYECPAFARLLRTDNTCSKFGVYDGVTELGDIGMKNVPSTTGNNDAIGYVCAGSANGIFRYIGCNDIVTDKRILLCSNSGSATAIVRFDAGAHGGITFNGDWTWDSSWGRTFLMSQFILMGSNAAPCKINGKIGGNKVADHGTDKFVNFSLTKRGSGEWSVYNNGNFFRSVVSVEEGTLGFAGIREKGEKCALGLADDLKAPEANGDYTTAAAVDFAIKLGSPLIEYPADNLATLRYIAATNASCTTRPVVLAGDARVCSDSNKLVLRGVSSISNGLNRLVLAGNSAAVTNVLHDITDGEVAAKQTGVVKEGDGAWILTGTNSFTGPIAVNGGRLILRRPSDQYTWYRLVVKDSYYIDSAEAYDAFKIGRIGLFDAAGYQQNIGFECRSDRPDNAGAVLDENLPSFMEPGQFGWGMPQCYYWWISSEEVAGQGLSALCRVGACHDNSCMFFARSGIKSHYVNEPDKYLFIDMRLTNGTPDIAYYDIAVVYETNANLVKMNMKTWSLLGSTDGINWDTLHEIEDLMSGNPDQKMKVPTSANSWMAMDRKTYSSDSAVTQYDTAKLQDIPSRRSSSAIPFFENGVGTVSVANGAVLEADGDITLSKFTAAAGGTAGTVKGFKLAADCEIEVIGIPARAAQVDVPIVFVGVQPKDAEWTVMDNGVESSKFFATAVNGQLRLIRRGSMLIIR